MSELEENIKAAIHFSGISSTGFHQLKCPVCGDKKIRAGFRFEPDKIVYNCFRGRCDASTEYVYGEPMYKKFRNLMDIFHIDIPIEIRSRRKVPKAFEELDKSLFEKHYYNEIELMPDFRNFCPDRDHKFYQFLKRRHGIFKQNLFVGQKDKWKNRLIIPFYHNNKLIGWQGVNEDDWKIPYLNSSGNTDLIYINNPNGYLPKVPIIVEGIMDAVVLPNGVAVLGNSVSAKQAYILRHSKPVLVPDRKDSKFVSVAKRYGWRVSIPNWSVKDTNAAVQRYGVFITAKMIHDGIQDNILKAETRYKMWRTK